MTSSDRRLVAVAGAQLDVVIFDAGADARAPVIAAAHPADAFNEGTAALLADAVGPSRIVCINPRGVGASTPLEPAQRYTLADMVDDIEAVRHALALPPWIFWGMSGGGWLAQLYAHRHAHALSHVIIESVCPCFRLRLADAACLASPLHPAWRAKLDAAGLLDAHAHDDAGDVEWREVAGVGAVLCRRDGGAVLVAPMALPPALLHIMPELWRFDARGWLDAVTTPALVIAGSADPIVPVAHARAVHTRLRDSEWLLVDGAGHVPVQEKREEVQAGVRRWLSSRRSS
jgi:pimeloyl-ACP methyl ester carboxylesterase